jgi:hypothetical protein
MKIDSIRDIIQHDIANRGLKTDPRENLVTACADDFRLACQSIAGTPHATLGIVTGFYIPAGEPPAAETDGPLGAVFIARALAPLGIPVTIFTDLWCSHALEVGLRHAGLSDVVHLHVLSHCDPVTTISQLTHLVALERVGPSHTLESLEAQLGATATEVEQFEREVPVSQRNRCHTMRGRDNTVETAPAHRLFESIRARHPEITTIGIGDGGNEIGMGKIRWDVIRRNISNGALIACRVPTEFLIVCGISNWGAYGLATGIRLLRTAGRDRTLFDIERERAILQAMISEGPLVDGVTGFPTLSVDGIPFDRYAEPLHQLRSILGSTWHE